MLSYSRGDLDNDLIFALATPRGVSSIAMVRLSGARAMPLIRRLAPHLPEKLESHRCYRSALVGSGKEFDDALVTYFAEGRSYTGEVVFEISCHGNMAIVDQLFLALMELGAREALPGEFTYRAVMNGKMDLLQAEAVFGLIHSKGPEAITINKQNISGHLSGIIKQAKEDILWCLAQLEANIDFSEQGIVGAEYDTILEKLARTKAGLAQLVRAYEAQKFVYQGFKIVLLGRPNAGKSSLFNCLVGTEKAIVSPTPGTTRDVIDANYVLNGVPVVIHDTAGLNENTSDEIEKIGIGRSYQKAKEADLALLLVDGSVGPSFTGELSELLELGLREKIVVVTKSDLLDKDKRDDIKENLPEGVVSLFVSSLSGDGLDDLESEISQKIGAAKGGESAYLATQRQVECVQSAVSGLAKSCVALGGKESEELVTIGLMESLLSLQTLLGERFEDQVMDKVFKEFCIGK